MDNKNEKSDKSKLKYKAPEVIYEGQITTRAGSPCPDCGKDNLIDPADLFKS